MSATILVARLARMQFSAPAADPGQAPGILAFEQLGREDAADLAPVEAAQRKNRITLERIELNAIKGAIKQTERPRDRWHRGKT